MRCPATLHSFPCMVAGNNYYFPCCSTCCSLITARAKKGTSSLVNPSNALQVRQGAKVPVVQSTKSPETTNSGWSCCAPPSVSAAGLCREICTGVVCMIENSQISRPCLLGYNELHWSALQQDQADCLHAVCAPWCLCSVWLLLWHRCPVVLQHCSALQPIPALAGSRVL